MVVCIKIIKKCLNSYYLSFLLWCITRSVSRNLETSLVIGFLRLDLCNLSNIAKRKSGGDCSNNISPKDVHGATKGIGLVTACTCTEDFVCHSPDNKCYCGGSPTTSQTLNGIPYKHCWKNKWVQCIVDEDCESYGNQYTKCDANLTCS